MFRDIWIKSLWDSRRALLGWMMGLIAVTVVYGAFYPFMADPAYSDLLETLPPGLIEAMGWEDFNTAEGYMGAAVFGVLGQVLVVILGVTMGARLLAGDEESGGLELLIAHPVSRSRVLLQRTLTLTLVMVAAGLAVFLAILALSGPIDLGLPPAHLAAAAFQLALLGLLFGALALAIGGVTGRKGAVIAVTAAVAVMAYLADTMAPMVESLAWVERLSPFDWYDPTEILRSGAASADIALCLAVSAIFVVIGLFGFQRRDVGV